MSYQYIADISAILSDFIQFSPNRLSSADIVLGLTDTQNIDDIVDISRHFKCYLGYSHMLVSSSFLGEILRLYMHFHVYIGYIWFKKKLEKKNRGKKYLILEKESKKLSQIQIYYFYLFL